MKKLKTYEEINFGCFINESIILYSNKLINVLNRILKMDDVEWGTDAFEEGIGDDSTMRNGRYITGKKISRDVVQSYVKTILDKLNTTDEKVNYLYFDLDDSGNITYSRTNVLKSDDEKELLALTEDDPSKENINKLIYNLIDKPKETIKLGRWFKAIGLNTSHIIIDELVKRMHNYIKPSYIYDDIEVEVVKGDDIKHYYNINNCIGKDFVDSINKLHDTCMVNVDGDFFEIYSQNPDKINLLIATYNGKLVARTLIWNTESGQFHDIIYSANQSGIDKINNFLKGNNISGIVENSIIKLGYIPTLDDKFPFIDTMCYLDIDNNTLSNRDNNKIKLQDDLGGYSVYIDGDYIKSDSVEYGITTSGENGFIKKTMAVYSSIYNTFIDERIVVETMDDDIYHIYSDEVVKLEPSIYGDGEYIMKDESMIDYMGRIIDEEDSTPALVSLELEINDDYFKFKDTFASIIDIRKNNNFTNVIEIEKTDFYKYYIKPFGEFIAISNELITLIDDNYVLNNYIDCVFVNVGDVVITQEIADTFNIEYVDTFKGYDIFSIFNTIKEKGDILGISPSELVKRIPRDTFTYKMFVDLTKTKRGINF